MTCDTSLRDIGAARASMMVRKLKTFQKFAEKIILAVLAFMSMVKHSLVSVMALAVTAAYVALWEVNVTANQM